jgi:hypothetical protein
LMLSIVATPQHLLLAYLPAKFNSRDNPRLADMPRPSTICRGIKNTHLGIERRSRKRKARVERPGLSPNAFESQPFGCIGLVYAPCVIITSSSPELELHEILADGKLKRRARREECEKRAVIAVARKLALEACLSSVRSLRVANLEHRISPSICFCRQFLVNDFVFFCTGCEGH